MTMKLNQFAKICVLQKAVMYCLYLNTVVVNEPCVIFESKDGAYEPLFVDLFII